MPYFKPQALLKAIITKLINSITSKVISKKIKPTVTKHKAYK